MPSTYSTSLGLELIGNGEQAGTWGTTTNNNLGTLLEQAIAGVQPITLTGGDYTLTDYNGLPDEARNAVLVLGGLLGAPCNVIAPSVKKVYIVRNFSNATVTIKTATGTGVALTNAASAVVFCDGTDFYSATTLNYIDGNLTVTGDTALQNNVSMATKPNAVVTVSGVAKLNSDVLGNANTGQWYLPVGNTTQRNNASPVNGLIRFNSDGGGFYEGYANGTWLRFVTAPEGNYSIAYLIAAGGGGGGGAGGGGGGLLTGSITAVPTTTYTITIGGGGAAGGSSGYNGGDSSIAGVVTVKGGGTAATAGGSGGGGFAAYIQPVGTPGGAGIPGQGYDGGTGGGYDPNNYGGGGSAGGGGAGARGGDGGYNNSTGGSGGSGYASSITGVISYYAGGGGGGGAQGGGGSGGAGGGGNGQTSNFAGGSGGVNTGGGGGSGGLIGGAGGAGGSGLCILSIPTVNYTGNTTGTPVVTTVGSNTILKYTISGTYTA